MMKGAFFHYAGNYRCFYTGKTSAAAYLYSRGLYTSPAALMVVRDGPNGETDPVYSWLPREMFMHKYSERVIVHVIIIALTTLWCFNIIIYSA